MTHKISLIVGIAVTALAFGVSAAFGERPLVGPPDGVAYFYANERATLGFGPVIHDHGDAIQANLLLQSPAMEIVRDHGDATQAMLVEQGSTSVGSSDQVRLDPNKLSTPTVSASSGSEIQWPQLGIGFGLGILLVAGLWLAMRMTKGRPLAH